MAPMASSDSEVKNCSKTCLKNYESLKKQYDDLLAKQLQTKFESATYKRGLDTVEAQLVTYRKNEVLFSEEVVVLKREVEFKQYEINTLKAEFEKLKKEKDNIDFKIEKFDKASKDLDQLLESQITDKSKKGFGYSAVPPPHPLIYNRPNKLDLSYSGLDEFKEPEFKGYGPENSKKESNIVKESDNSKENSDKSLVKELESQVKSRFVKGCGSNTSERVSEVEPKKVRENNDAPIIGDWVSDDAEQDESMIKPVRKTVIPTAGKIEKPVRKSVRNVTPRAVLLRIDLKPLGTAKPDYTAHPKPTVHCARPKTHFFKSAQSTIQRPFYKKPALTNRHFNHKVNTVRPRIVNTARSYRTPVNTVRPRGKPQHDDKGFVDSGCSRHMTGNIAYLSDFKQFDGGYVAFGGGAYGGKISGKGTLKTANLDFEDVYFVNELKFNLFSVSQMCDKKNYVLFTDTECLVLSPNFKLPDENHILLKVPRKDNLYSFDIKNIVPKERKQRRASCKSKVLNPITKPLFMLHMDFFGPTFVSSLMHKKYCLVVTDDYSRFTWVFFLTTKDETSEILKRFIKEIENLVDKKVSVARSAQQNGVAERRNRTLIEAARTMLADSKLPTTFWAEAVSTACYVQNRVLVVKPHNKTPYELFRGFKPALSFMRPFGCHVTILNTLDSLGKFDGKSDEGFFVGYSLSSKAFRVYNTRTKRVEENLHIGFLENKPMIEGTGPKWLFDIDSLTQSMNYVPVTANTSYFDSPTKNVDNGEPKTADDAQKQVEDGLNNKNAEQEGFAEIIDFLETSSVSCALTVNPLQTLVDKKRVIVTESSIRRDLHLNDAEGTDYLPTATIFEELARMGAKSTTWNEFSSSMASLIICLATNQKFNLSKYIFDAMKVFANMKRGGKDFFGRITPLFDTMMVQPIEEMGEDLDHPTDSTPIHIIDQPSSSSQPKKKQLSNKDQRQEVEVPQDEVEHEESVRAMFQDQVIFAERDVRK
ncbi:putative ribonuclease H-like domain-containing protein [Tanacetum coccineum]